MKKVFAVVAIVLGLAVFTNASATVYYNYKKCDSKYRKLSIPASDSYSALRVMLGKDQAKDLLTSYRATGIVPEMYITPTNSGCYAYYANKFETAWKEKNKLLNKRCKKQKKAITKFYRSYNDLPNDLWW